MPQICLFFFLILAYCNSLIGSESELAPPFTGEVSRQKVRLRIAPDLDSEVVRDCKPGEKFVAIKEEGDFYAVIPPSDIKGYVYRTYVLDGIIEGNRVNVRLAPELDAPVLTQLNQGTPVKGAIVPDHPKWLAIELPQNLFLYVYKDYITKLGPPNLIAQLEKRHAEAEALLGEIRHQGALAMARPFEEIDLTQVFNLLNRLVNQYREETEIIKSAKGWAEQTQDVYLKRKIEYLEALAQKTPLLQKESASLAAEASAHKKRADHLQQRLVALENQFKPLPEEKAILAVRKDVIILPTDSPWWSAEEALFTTWKGETEAVSIEDFYKNELKNSSILEGIIETYERKIKNKPGDYLLVDSATNCPLAYLYSTRIPLQEYLGRKVVLRVRERSNHHFALPAFYVLQIEPALN